MNTLRDENLYQCLQDNDTKSSNELRIILKDCVDKITQGSNQHHQRSDEGVVSVEKISKIQEILKQLKIIGLDSNENEDPMGVLLNILELLNPNLALFIVKETRYYNLQEAEKGEEVKLTEEELGPKGITIVDQEGKSSSDIPDIVIPLENQNGVVNIPQALNDYQNNQLEQAPATVCTLLAGDQYQKYTNVKRISTTRTFTKPPLSLILELKGKFDQFALAPIETKVEFQEWIQLATDDNTQHYYELQQVNCHENNHEYAYLKSQGTWYLSDDMNAVRLAQIQQSSKDANQICCYGKTFIYKKIDQANFNNNSALIRYEPPPIVWPPVPPQIASLQKTLNQTAQIQKKQESPEQSLSQTSPNSGVDEMVSKQLEGLIEFCEQLSNPNEASLETLLDFSWGVGSIPKEKKFSKQWGTVICERHWLLLEDIARQITKKFAFPDEQTIESRELVSQFSKSAISLKKAFEKLLGKEVKIPSLSPIETLFEDDFDKFVLDQVEKNIKVLRSSLGSEDPLNWLKKKHHVKALFRVVEVIGEAAKILSDKAKKQLPTLVLSSQGKNEKPLWGKLRNQLHHNKSRTWDVAIHAPEHWAAVLSELFPELEEEITQYSTNPTHNTTSDNSSHRLILETLCSLCGQDQFREVRHKWSKLSKDFDKEPKQLIRILFGFEDNEKNNFLELWNEYAEPYLTPETDKSRNQLEIFEMLRIGNKNLINRSDIEQLTPSTGVMDKKTAIKTLKQLLLSVHEKNSPDLNKKLAREFDKLADQFVFIQVKNKKGSDKTDRIELLRDVSKNEVLKKIMSQRLSQVSSFIFSEATFFDGNGTPTEYGLLLTSYVNLKHHRVSQLIENMKLHLNQIQATWPQTEIDASHLEMLGNASKAQKQNKEKPDLKNSFIADFEQLQCEGVFIGQGLPDKEDENLKTLIENLKELPSGRIANYLELSVLVNEIKEKWPQEEIHEIILDTLKKLKEQTKPNPKKKILIDFSKILSNKLLEEEINDLEKKLNDFKIPP